MVKSGHGVIGMIAVSHVVLEYRVKLELAIAVECFNAVLIWKKNMYGNKNAIHMLVVSERSIC